MLCKRSLVSVGAILIIARACALGDEFRGAGQGLLVGQYGSAYLQSELGAGRLTFTGNGDLLLSQGIDTIAWSSRQQTQAWWVNFAELGSPECLAVSPDGNRFAGGYGSTVVLGRCSDGHVIRKLRLNRYEVRGIAWSADGTRIVAAGSDRSLAVWDSESGRVVKKSTWVGDPKGPLALSGDGSRLGTCDVGQGIVRVWDVSNSKQLTTIKNTTNGIRTLVLSPDGRLLVLAPDEGSAILWDVNTQGRRAVLDKSDACFGFSRSGKLLAAGSYFNEISIWDVATGQRVRQLKSPSYPAGNGSGVYTLAFAPDEKVLASGGLDNSIRMWRVASGEELPSPPHHHLPVRFIVHSRDGQLVATEAMDESIRIWRTATRDEVLRVEKPTRSAGYVPFVSFSLDGTQLIARTDDQDIQFWDLRSKTKQRTLKLDHQDPAALAVSPDGKILAFEEGDRRWRVKESWLQLLNVDSGKRLARLRVALQPEPLPGLGILAGRDQVAFSPDGKVLAWSGKDNVIHLWDVAQTKELRFLPSNNRPVMGLSFSPDGRWLACREIDPPVAGSHMGESLAGLRLWDVARGRELLLIQPGEYVFEGSFAWSPDGATIACTYGRGPLRVWEVLTGLELLRIGEGKPGPQCVDYAPDGRTLCTGMPNGTALVWSLAPTGWTKPPAAKLSPQQLETLWNALGKADALAAYSAVWSLSDAPHQSLSWLKEHLQFVATEKAMRVKRLVSELDDDQFETREAAMRELIWLGPQTEPVLRQILAGTPSEEIRTRIEAILKTYDEWVVKDSKTLTALRAIWVLKRIGGPEARAILARLAGGDPHARVTKEALAACALLERQGR